MALTNYKHGAQTIRKFDDVNTDFPTTGVGVADTITIGIDNTSGAPCTVEYTLDGQFDIDGGTATWINSVSVATANDAFIITEYGPTGVKLTCGAVGCVAWIKS